MVARLLAACAFVAVSGTWLGEGAQAATIRPACSNTAGDTAVIQKAFNNLKPGDTLILQKMCGVGSAGLKLTGKSNVVIKGLGRGTGFRALATPATNAGLGKFGWGPMMIDVTNCDRCTFRDMDFNMNHHQTGAVIFHNLTNGLFENVNLRWGTVAQSYMGLNVHPATMVGVIGIQKPDGQPSPANNVFRGNLFESSCCPGRHVQRGLFIAHSLGTIVENNTFRKLSHTALAPLNAPGFKVLNNAFRNNRYDGVKASTLDNYRELSGSETKTLFFGNVIVHQSANGINLHNMSNVEIRNNILADNNNGAAFTGTKGSKILIEKNSFCDNYQHIYYEHGFPQSNVIILRNNQVLKDCANLAF